MIVCRNLGNVRPETFSSIEHPLTHDARSGAFEGRLQEAVLPARLTTFAKLEILAEELLLEHPLLEIHPLTEPIVVTRVVGVRQIHPFGGEEAVESHSHAEEHFAQDDHSSWPSRSVKHSDQLGLGSNGHGAS